MDPESDYKGSDNFGSESGSGSGSGSDNLKDFIFKFENELNLNSVSRHTQTREISYNLPLLIYYMPISYESSYEDADCSICFKTKSKLKWTSEVVRSRIEPPYHLYFNKDELLKFVDKHPNESFIVKKEFFITFDQIENSWFDDDKIPDNLILPFPCNKHDICMECLRRILNDYSNHPINIHNSHVQCQYPFAICEERLEHHHVKKILSEEQFLTYYKHADKYEFPGYKKIKCPGKYWINQNSAFTDCFSTILVNVSDIKKKEVGDLIMKCDTNISCLGKFCYHCNRALSYFQDSCLDCKMKNENTNPNSYNYFFNTPLAENESENDFLLYKNEEITFDIAVSQLKMLIKDINSFYICPVCKIPMTKTEKCNGLSHHDIERCFVCGRIGQPIRGLSNHWDENGIGGCYRFYSDSYPILRFKYDCLENLCHNHEIGECSIKEHQFPLIQLEIDRKRAFILHAINSLLPDIRFKVFDHLLEYYKDSMDIYYLPERETLDLLVNHPERYLDYSEEIVHEQIKKMKRE